MPQRGRGPGPGASRDEWEVIIPPSSQTEDEWEPITEPEPVEVPKERGLLGTIWDKTFGPEASIFPGIAKTTRGWAESITDPSKRLDEEGNVQAMHPLASFGAGALEGIGDLASGMATPGNIATMGAFGGASAAARAGLPAVARGLNLTGRGLSAGIATHGAEAITDPEASMGERAMGVAELAGGGAGMLVPTPRPRINPRIARDIAPEVIPESAPVPNELDELTRSLGVADDLQVLDPATSRVNASGESAASMEAMSRQQGMQSKGQQFVVYDRSGNKKPLIGPDAVDYKVKQGESYGIEGPDGFTLLDDAGGKPPSSVAARAENPSVSSEPVLPRDLQGSKPRFNMGQDSYTPKFESDLDKALFILAQKNASKREADFLAFVKKTTGWDDAKIRAEAQNVKSQVKEAVRSQEPGEVTIPRLAPPRGPDPRQTTGNKPSAIYLKNPTPMTIKRTMEGGYILDPNNPIREDGAIRYIKTDKPVSTPILEAEVPLKTTRRQTGGGDEPPRPPNKAIDEGPIRGEPAPPKTKEEKASRLREAYELSRALMSIDLPFTTSAAFRQALPHLGTKNWFRAFGTSIKSYGSEASYQATMKRIHENPLFRPRPKPGGKFGETQQSFADEIGVKMTELGKLSQREEMLRSRLAEKIPGYGRLVRASNRAYTAFLNDLRASTLENLVKDSKIMGSGGMNNLPLMREVAEFINTTTGRSSLRFDVGISPTRGRQIDLEKGAKILTDVMFSPRLMASRIKILNPSTYLMANPAIRKQYLHGLLRSIGGWWAIASLAEMAGAKVSKDPNSADFGKIRIGDTRLDPGGGLQQFLVLGSRMRPQWAGVGEGTDVADEIPGGTALDLATGLAGHGGGGITSSVSGRHNEYGQGFKPETRFSTLTEFSLNKAHPTLKFAIDLLRASESRPVNLADRTVQMFLPIISGDIAELIKEDPQLVPLIALLGTFGMGSQTYSGGIEEPSFIPDKYDIKIGGR